MDLEARETNGKDSEKREGFEQLEEWKDLTGGL